MSEPRPKGRPPQERPGTLSWVLISLFALLVFAIAVGAVFGPTLWDRASAPVNATNDWLTVVRDGDLPAAADLTCADSAASELVSFIESYTGAPITDFDMKSGTSSGPDATVDGSITGPSGQWDFTVYLVDDGGWKVCEVG